MPASKTQKAKSPKSPRLRKDVKVDLATRIQVLTEAGYRCAVPTCRHPLALDLHHMEEVSAGGSDDVGNLLALCPTCHSLYHRGTIRGESIYAWKSMLITLSRAYSPECIDSLLLLADVGDEDTDPMAYFKELKVSGDAVLRLAPLINSGMVTYLGQLDDDGQRRYRISITPFGRMYVDAWRSGRRDRLKEAMSGELARGCLDEQ